MEGSLEATRIRLVTQHFTCVSGQTVTNVMDFRWEPKVNYMIQVYIKGCHYQTRLLISLRRCL